MSKRKRDAEEGPVLFYECRFYCFSNFSSFAVEYNGRVWMTSEHLYQALKFRDRNIQDEIFDARSAHLAKIIAHQHAGYVRSDWDKIKVEMMEKVCRAKLRQHAFVERRLRESGSRVLIENSDRDVFWGWGPNQRGENQLGKIWMKFRSELHRI